MTTFYIKRYDVDSRTTETVSECTDRPQAESDLREYQFSEPSDIARYSLSKTPSKDWHE